MKRASVPTVVNKLGHNGFCGYESVLESVLVSVPERLKRPGAIDCFTASASGGFLILDWQAASLQLLFKRLARTSVN